MPTYSIEDVNYLTSLAFSAALDASKWQDFLEEARRISGGVRTHLFGYDFDTNTNFGVIYAGYDPEFIRSYDDYYFAHNAWAEGFVTADVGVPVFSQWMCPPEKLEQTEFYADWVRPQEDVVSGGGSLLFKEERRMIAFGGNIRRRDETRLQKDWMDLVALVTPHLQQAFEISRRLDGISLEKSALARVTSSEGTAVLVVNSEGHLLFTNRAAERLIASGEIIGESTRRKLQFMSETAALSLDMALRLLQSGALRSPQGFQVASEKSRLRYLCRTGWLDPQALDLSPISILAGLREPALLVTLSPERLQKDLQAILVAQFGLTGQESSVLVCFRDGMTLREIADMRRVSVYTIRNQLKSAMAKLDLHRQADLMSFLNQI